MRYGFRKPQTRPAAIRRGLNKRAFVSGILNGKDIFSGDGGGDDSTVVVEEEENYDYQMTGNICTNKT